MQIKQWFRKRKGPDIIPVYNEEACQSDPPADVIVNPNGDEVEEEE